jgi:hypothetical protein
VYPGGLLHIVHNHASRRGAARGVSGPIPARCPRPIPDSPDPLWTHTLPDGSAIAQHSKWEAIDRVEQLLVGQRRYQWIQQGRVVQEEIYQANERWYFKHEMMLRLEKGGFRNVRVKRDWTDEDFTEPHRSIVFIATKG